MRATRQTRATPRTFSARTLRAGLAATCALLVPALTLAANVCTVSAQTHAFGAYDTINPLAGTSTITVTCSHTSNSAVTFAYSVALSTGPGSYPSRQMTGGGNTLNYNLYTSATNTTVWGNGTSGTAVVNGSVTVPANSSGFLNHTVYGLIGGSQNVTPAAYSTATPITVTVADLAGGSKFSTTTTTFNTTASVAARCQVSVGNLAFGAVNPLSSQVDATSSITVSCTKNSAYTVGLNAGVTAGATIAQRLMANGPDTMLFNLYTDATRSSVWGNSAGSWATGIGAGMTIPQTLTVYGRVANGQTNLAVGNYRENTITVTATY